MNTAVSLYRYKQMHKALKPCCTMVEGIKSWCARCKRCWRDTDGKEGCSSRNYTVTLENIKLANLFWLQSAQIFSTYHSVVGISFVTTYQFKWLNREKFKFYYVLNQSHLRMRAYIFVGYVGNTLRMLCWCRQLLFDDVYHRVFIVVCCHFGWILLP